MANVQFPMIKFGEGQPSVDSELYDLSEDEIELVGG